LIGIQWFVAHGWHDENAQVLAVELVLPGTPHADCADKPLYQEGLPLPEESAGNVWVYYFPEVDPGMYFLRVKLSGAPAPSFVCFPVEIKPSYAGVVEIQHPAENEILDNKVFVPYGTTTEAAPPPATVKVRNQAATTTVQTKMLPGNDDPKRWYGFIKDLNPDKYTLTVTTGGTAGPQTRDFELQAGVAR
jgi:hypothetical protein